MSNNYVAFSHQSTGGNTRLSHSNSGNYDLKILGELTIEKKLSLTIASGIGLDVTANATIGGTLGVTNTSTLGVLTVGGASTFNENVSVSGTKTLTVGGVSKLDGGIEVATNKFVVTATNGNTAVAGTLVVTGATTVNDVTKIGNDSTTLKLGINKTTPAKTLDVVGTFEATGVATLGNNLTVAGTTTLADTLSLTKTSGNALVVNTDKFTVDAATGNVHINGTLSFEGSTADGFETTLAVTDPTADRTITFPDAQGTVCVTGGTGLTLTAAGTMNVDATQSLTGLTVTNKITGDISGNCDGNAGSVTDGVYTTGDQTIGGIKTFSSKITGNISGNCDGSAATLTTARNIGGVSFNGSADIPLPGVNTAGNQNTSGSAATLTTARNIGGVSFNGSADIPLPGVNTAGNQDTSGTATNATYATYATQLNCNPGVIAAAGGNHGTVNLTGVKANSSWSGYKINNGATFMQDNLQYGLHHDTLGWSILRVSTGDCLLYYSTGVSYEKFRTRNTGCLVTGNLEVTGTFSLGSSTSQAGVINANGAHTATVGDSNNQNKNSRFYATGETTNFSQAVSYSQSSGVTYSIKTAYAIYAGGRGSAGNSTSHKAQGIWIGSDSRIKTNIEDVQDDSALVAIRNLQPKKYNYVSRDTTAAPKVYGYIAQEVIQVIPEAVSSGNTNPVPDILESCAIIFQEDSGKVTSGTITLETKDTSVLSVDNIVSCRSIQDKEVKIKVTQIVDSKNFTFTSCEDPEFKTEDIEQIDEGNFIFVYGKEVNDFHIMKKDAIWTVATAALQEVDRQLQAEKAKVASLETTVADLLARVVALESA